MQQRGRQEPGRSVLWWAFGASVVAHALLVLIGFWIPIRSHSAPAEEPEQTIRFTFADEQPDEPTTDGQRRGEVMLPEETDSRPPSPPPEPVPSMPELVRLSVPPDPQPPPLPEPAEQPVEPSDATSNERPDDTEDETDRELDRDPADPLDADQESPGVELEQDDRAVFSSPGGTPAPPPETRPRVGLDRALRQFRDQILQSRPRISKQPAQGTFENVFVPDPADLPVSGSPFAFLEHESRDFDFSDYDRQIYFAILFAWYNRLYETAGEFEKWGHENRQMFLDHRSRIRFTIQHDGDVTDIVVETPAGCVPLDDSAAEALDEVILPPLPDDFPRDLEVIHGTFLARGEILGLRPFFERLKRQGLF